MTTFLLLILCSFAGDFIALSFGISMISREKWVDNFAKYATPFAAGTLLAAAFTDVLPDSSTEGPIQHGLYGALAGIMIFFILERFLHWFHHRQDGNDTEADRDATVPLIVVGNVLHRAVDGVAIAAGFLSSPRLGVVVTIAIVIHEIPHTAGDFGLLLYKGVSRTKTILINCSVAIFTTLIAIFIYWLGSSLKLPLDYLDGLTAGFFIYIAVSDIIPDIHEREKKQFIGLSSLLLILGAVFLTLMMYILHHTIGSV